jgi:hypothetical protein
MQIALRPVAVRALLLIVGVALGLIAFLSVFAAVGSTHSDHSVLGGGHTVTARGVGWI